MQRPSSRRCEPSGRQDERKAGVVRHKAATWFTEIPQHPDLTQSSPGDRSLSEISGAAEFIAAIFKEPLGTVGFNLLVLQDQITEMVEYAKTDAYHKVWYKLHVCPDASRWQDVLILCKLCFSLPPSNGRVERIFSSLKLIKMDGSQDQATS